MTDKERAALIAYLQEQRRHLIAQVKACEVLLLSLGADVCYNKADGNKANR